MTLDSTESMQSDSRPRPRVDWALVVALDCQSLVEWPETFALTDLAEVSVGRGASRRFVKGDTPAARLELADRWVSQSHARLSRNGDLWSIADDGSTNGIHVNGERVAHSALADGDVITCGGTFLILRRTDGYVRPVAPLAEGPAALRTMSPAYGYELDFLRKVARSSVPLLVQGESGTGRTRVIRAVHELSGRRGSLSTFVTGTDDPSTQLLAVDGGTLFITELADLPVADQAVLLRLVEERELHPAGAEKATPVDIRVVAATRRPGSHFTKDGRIRRDLYARLRGFELRLPPLRERREDLGQLITALILRHDPAGPPRTLSRAAAAAIFAYSWPLNIRELEESLCEAFNASGGAETGLDHLPRHVRDACATPRTPSSTERERLVAILERHGGNLSAVARELVTSRSQLYRLLARHAIRPW